jgi:hypothetical protein
MSVLHTLLLDRSMENDLPDDAVAPPVPKAGAPHPSKRPGTIVILRYEENSARDGAGHWGGFEGEDDDDDDEDLHELEEGDWLMFVKDDRPLINLVVSSGANKVW